MSATPPPTNPTPYNVPNVGTVSLSAAGLNSSNWPPLWGCQPPTSDPPTPASLSDFAEHMGFHLGPLFTLVNTALAKANSDFANGQHPPAFVALIQAMQDLNQFLNSSDSEQRRIQLNGGRLAMPFVASIGNGDPTSQPIGFTASYTPSNQFTGNLYIHVDGEPMSSAPSGYGSWQIVTGFEIEIWFMDSSTGEAADVGVGGGPSSSSSYYASSSSGPATD